MEHEMNPETPTTVAVAEAVSSVENCDPTALAPLYDVVDTDGRIIGTVTSGTMSPTLGDPIGMGYLPVEYADPGTALRVVVRGEQKEARVRNTPFIQ